MDNMKLTKEEKSLIILSLESQINNKLLDVWSRGKLISLTHKIEDSMEENILSTKG
jgi:hypothetical protein